jgi:hypothetical protein
MYTAYYVVVPKSASPIADVFQVYPNPFNPKATIAYSIHERGHVQVSVMNLLGQEVAVLVEDDQEAGAHRVVFDGSQLASGVYYCRLLADQKVQLRRILLVR